MLSCIGNFVSEYLTWPGHQSPAEELKFEDISDGLATFDKVLFIGWVLILTFVDLIEVFNRQIEPREFSGDYELFSASGLQALVRTKLESGHSWWWKH